MEDDTATLEVGFAINAGTSFAEIERLQAFMQTAEFKAIKSADQMEKAFNGLNLNGATAQIEAFGGVATREMQRAERAGEAMVRQLKQQAETYGKTASEIRIMRAEARAAAADAAGLTELGERIRLASDNMQRMERGGLQPLIPTGKLASHHMQNLAFQFQDLGIQMAAAAQSSAPVKMAFMALLQQGAQIKGIMSQAEIGIGGVGRAFWAMLLPFAPVIAGVAAVSAGMALLVRNVNQGVTNDQLTRDLGKITGGANATKQELYKLKDETVTWGDVTKAVFSEIGKDVASQFVDDFKSMSDGVKDVLDSLTGYAKMALAGMYAGVAGMRKYLAEIEKGGVSGLVDIASGKSDILDKSFGAAYRDADKYLTGLGERIKAQSVKNARQRLADKIGYNNQPKEKTDKHAEQLAREAAATEAQIRNLYALADAYSASGAAALIAEARVKAETDAIKKRADIEERVERQIRLAIAQRVSDAAKGAAATREQARIQTEINAAVAAGEISAEQANELLRERIAELPLLAALEVAQQRGLKAEVEAATKALEGQRSAAADARAAATGAFFTGAAADAERRLAVLDAEYKLIGATNLERARGLAVVRAEQELKAKGQPLGTPYANGYVGDAVKVAEQTERNTAATREWTDSIYAVSDAWDLIARNVQQAASGMADAFGPAGRAIGDVASIYANFSAQQERASAVHKEALRNASTQTAKDRENARFALANSTAQVGMYGDMAAAAKGFFKEKSAGYQAMMVAEKVFRAFEFAMSVRSMVQDVAETFASVANSGARATAAGAEGIANQSKLPFPFNIAAMAATGAALVAAGIAVLSGGGGGRNSAPVSNTGTGTVLGDKGAQSESIKRSLDLLRDVDTLMLTESRRMVASLRSIDSQIGGLAAVLVRSGNLNADSQVAQGFKPNAIGSVLGSIPIVGGLLGSLFGSKTKVIGSGIYGGAMSLDAILAGAGYNAQTYSDVEKKKKFFGITTSTKFSTVYGGAVDSSVSDQFGLILRSFNDAILAAAGPLGNATDEIKSRLSGFIFSLGKIDLTGLSGSEIQEKLAAVFGAAADNMAEAAFPGISRFQKVGEGAFETLVRVSSTVEAVSTTLGSLGKAAIGLSIDAKVALANQFDTIGDFTSAAQSYFDAFYTKEEQASARAAQLTRVFGSMNLVMPRTLTGFRQLVDAQDLTTDAGRAAYATLLQLAPAFSDLMGSLGGAKTAADAAADLREAWTSIGDSIADEVKRIRALNNTGSSASFAQLQGRFNAATTGARGGDQDMARMLPQLSQDLLAAAERQATSRQELERIRALTAASLEQTNVSIISRTNSLTLDELLDRTATAQAASTRQAANDVVDATNDQTAALKDEIAGLRSDMTGLLASIVGNTDKTASILRDVTPDGDTLAIRTA